METGSAKKYTGNSIWTDEEDKLLERLWQNASLETVLEAFPKRTLSAIRNHARRLGLKRQRMTNQARIRRRWTEQDETQAQSLLNMGTPLSEIASKLNRTPDAIMQRAAAMNWHSTLRATKKIKPVVWRTIDQDDKGLQEERSQILSPSQIRLNPVREDEPV